MRRFRDYRDRHKRPRGKKSATSSGQGRSEYDSDDELTPTESGTSRLNPILLQPLPVIQDEDELEIKVDDIGFITSPWSKSESQYEETLKKLKATLDQFARDGDANSIREILGRRQDLINNIFRPKELNAPLDTPLHVAAKYGQLQGVEAIVEKLEEAVENDLASFLNRKGESGNTPLHLAISGRKQVSIDTKTKLVEYLMKKGADAYMANFDGHNALHYATMWGNPNVAKMILQKEKSIIKDTDNNGATALQLAISLNRNRVAKIIIEHMDVLDSVDGLTVPTADYEEHSATSPLHLACMKGNIDMVDLLFAAKDKFVSRRGSTQMIVNTRDSQGQSPLHVALGNRHFEVAKRCIEEGADVNVPGIGNNTPLHLAAVGGDKSIVELLLEKGANVDALNDHQSTALHFAAVLDKHEICTLLIESNANLELRNKPDLWTPLLLVAANAGNPTTIEKLLEHGADITVTDRRERGAVHLAADAENPSAIKVLLKHVKENNIEEDELIDSQNNIGNAPLHCAAEKGNLEAVQCLIHHKADLCIKNDDHKTPLHLASQNGMRLVVRELLKALPSMVNIDDKNGDTALHLAARAGEEQVARFLVYKGKANLEARNSYSETALHVAAREGWKRTCKFLLHKDAAMNPEDDRGRTPLHLACLYGKRSIIQLLIDASSSQQVADLKKKTKNGETCLDLAIQENEKEAALALVMSNRWRECLAPDPENKEETPLKKLIMNMPEVAKAVLYQCTVKNRDLREGEVEYVFNFEYLDDKRSEDFSSNGHHCLRLMMHYERFELLSHPLVIALLRQKWVAYGKAFYCTNLFIYAMFLTVLTVYVLSLAPMAPHHFLNVTELANYNGSFCRKVQKYTTAKGTPIAMPVLAIVCKYVIMFLCFEQVIRETIQRILASGFVYFTGVIHWIEILIYVTFHFATFLLVVDQSHCHAETGIRWEWQWQLGSVAMFFGWIHLLLFIRKVPVFGIYAVMFSSVFVSFLQFFPVFFLLIVAFALSFYCLLGNQIPFRGEGFSLYKTSVMMIGEFDYADIFHRRHEDDSADRPDAQIWYKAMTYILFTLFLVVMAVLVMNLLTGLAVGDTSKVQEASKSRTIMMQVSYLLDTERLMTKLKQIICCRRTRPEKASTTNTIILRKSNNLFVNNWVLSTASIYEHCKSVQAWKREHERTEEARQKSAEERESVKDTKDSIKTMNKLEGIVNDLDRKMEHRIAAIEDKLGEVAAVLRIASPLLEDRPGGYSLPY